MDPRLGDGGEVVLANDFMFSTFASYFLVLVWCIVATVTGHAYIGLVLSAVCVIVWYHYCRGLSLHSMREFENVKQFISLRMVIEARRKARKTQLDAYRAELDEDLWIAQKELVDPQDWLLSKVTLTELELGLDFGDSDIFESMDPSIRREKLQVFFD